MWEQEYATTGYIYTDYVIPIGKKWEAKVTPAHSMGL